MSVEGYRLLLKNGKYAEAKAYLRGLAQGVCDVCRFIKTEGECEHTEAQAIFDLHYNDIEFRIKAASRRHPLAMLRVVLRKEDTSNSLYKRCLYKTQKSEDMFIKGMLLANKIQTIKSVSYKDTFLVKTDMDEVLECFYCCPDNMFANFMIAYILECLKSDENIVFSWYLKSAKAGYNRAQLKLCEFWFDKNRTKSWEWLRKFESHKPDDFIQCFRSSDNRFKYLARQERARNALLCIIMIKKYRKELEHVPMDVIKIITNLIWISRNEACWKKSTIKN